MNNRTKKLLILIVPVIFLMALIFYGKKQKNTFVSSIKKKSEISTGIVTGIYRHPKMITQVEYHFLTKKGEDVSSSASTHSFKDDYNLLITSKVVNKEFPVIYNTEEPNEFNQILISKSDFETFGLAYPKRHDSLFR